MDDSNKVIGYIVLDDQQVPSETYQGGAALYSSIRSAKNSRLWQCGTAYRPPHIVKTVASIYEVRMSGLYLIETSLATDDGRWKCPIDYPNCEKNCGNYGCGN